MCGLVWPIYRAAVGKAKPTIEVQQQKAPPPGFGNSSREKPKTSPSSIAGLRAQLGFPAASTGPPPPPAPGVESQQQRGQQQQWQYQQQQQYQYQQIQLQTPSPLRCLKLHSQLADLLDQLYSQLADGNGITSLTLARAYATRYPNMGSYWWQVRSFF